MSYAVQHLQSEMAAQGPEMSVLVNSQDGTAVGGPELDGVQLRVSIFPTTRGEKIVVRLFDPRALTGQTPLEETTRVLTADMM